jgi:hypothetical protein
MEIGYVPYCLRNKWVANACPNPSEIGKLLPGCESFH